LDFGWKRLVLGQKDKLADKYSKSVQSKWFILIGKVIFDIYNSKNVIKSRIYDFMILI